MLTAKLAAASALLALAAIPAAAQLPSVPAADIKAKAGETEVMTVGATGVQVYECRAGTDGRLAWAFKEPRAELTQAGKVIGRHYAGPHWELPDGSVVKVAPVARADAPSAGDIPWLRLDVVESRGNGRLTGVSVVLRTNTKGGMHSGACTEAGKLHEQPYTSDYVFLKR